MPEILFKNPWCLAFKSHHFDQLYAPEEDRKIMLSISLLMYYQQMYFSALGGILRAGKQGHLLPA